jgi:hypothetical protein
MVSRWQALAGAQMPLSEAGRSGAACRFDGMAMSLADILPLDYSPWGCLCQWLRGAVMVHGAQQKGRGKSAPSLLTVLGGSLSIGVEGDVATALPVDCQPLGNRCGALPGRRCPGLRCSNRSGGGGGSADSISDYTRSWFESGLNLVRVWLESQGRVMQTHPPLALTLCDIMIYAAWVPPSFYLKELCSATSLCPAK